MEWITVKILDVSSRFIWGTLVRFFKFVLPIKITPKKIKGGSSEFLPIISLRIKNRTRENLYNVRIAGISKSKFKTNIISDNIEKGKTVEHMSLNTNILVVDVFEKETNNYGWIPVLQKIDSGSTVDLKIKVDNKDEVYFKIMDYSFKERHVTERNDGVVGINFVDKPLPKI